MSQSNPLCEGLLKNTFLYLTQVGTDQETHHQAASMHENAHAEVEVCTQGLVLTGVGNSTHYNVFLQSGTSDARSC